MTRILFLAVLLTATSSTFAGTISFQPNELEVGPNSNASWAITYERSGSMNLEAFDLSVFPDIGTLELGPMFLANTSNFGGIAGELDLAPGVDWPDSLVLAYLNFNANELPNSETFFDINEISLTGPSSFDVGSINIARIVPEPYSVTIAAFSLFLFPFLRTRRF